MPILVLGAGGLIGNFIAVDLIGRGLPVIAAARRLTHAQRNRLGAAAHEIQISALDVAELTRLLRENEVDIVVNCLGILQDTPRESTRAIHFAFVEKLLAALRALGRPSLLVQLSIPGADLDDRTGFAHSKRAAEQAITQSGVAYAILRPGFVFAPAAYGGGAMLRALAALPLGMPAGLASRPFSVIAVEDIAETIQAMAQRWREGDHKHAARWDLMHPDQRSLGHAASLLRAWLGVRPIWRVAPPIALLKLGAWVGDLAAWLGWRPPLRSTALAELQRGVAGDPRAWMAATGITPRSLDDVLRERPATIQEKWFSRLYLLKALVIASLAVFWCTSALIVLTLSYPAAVAILTVHGYPETQAHFMTAAGSVMDFSIGLAIAFRRTCRWGLLAGIAVSLFYMLAAALLTPELWIEPLGALVKTGPAIVLMLVALAITDDR